MLHTSRDAGARCAREDSLDDRNLIGDFSSYEHREAHKNLEYIPCMKRQLRLKSNAIPATGLCVAAGYGYPWVIGSWVCRYALLLLLALSSILHHTLYLYLVFKGVGRYALLVIS